ncbi:MAG: 5'/3'-nucleotidase SurE [Gammaproteobacteria bacterium]
MKILVSNDDGVYAPGLATLVDHLSAVGDVQVVAPDRDRSAASHSLSLNRPIRAQQLPNGFYSVQGTPTDCVHLALTGFLKEKPDIVVAGINAGANLGDDVLYSGTVAAASEGRFLGLPAIAVSLVGSEHYNTAARITIELLQRLHNHPLPNFTLLNVNVPDVPYEQLRGVAITRLGKRHCAEPMVQETDPRGHPIYWVGPAGTEQDAGPGSDFYAINENKASITPIHLDLTHYESFDSVAHWLQDLA